MATTLSNRLAIGQALVALLQAIGNPSTSQPLYQYVKLGAIFDPGAATTFAEVVHVQGKGGPAGSGGPQIGWRIDDAVTFGINTGFGPYETDDSAAQSTMLFVQDVVLPTLRTHHQLPTVADPTQAVIGTYSLLIEQVDKSRPVRFPNGHVYLLWNLFATVKQQYSISLSTP